ncbi:hypothetical protein LCGC14_2631700 [marine sediment metagenome]|uniref:Uncharacterized protein n=1 Tax=marine sediment metagenome TaxID=412755 RepID=A0A0F9A097_9ZZZZ
MNKNYKYVDYNNVAIDPTLFFGSKSHISTIDYVNLQTIYEVNLQIVSFLLKCDALIRDSIRIGINQIPIKISELSTTLGSSEMTQMYFDVTTSPLDENLFLLELRKDKFWENYSELRKIYRKKGWEIDIEYTGTTIGAQYISPIDIHQMLLTFKVITQVEEKINKYALMDI